MALEKKTSAETKAKTPTTAPPTILHDALPLPPPRFQGKIGTYYTGSEAAATAHATSVADSKSCLGFGRFCLPIPLSLGMHIALIKE
jgi:hypothetical protein